MNKSSRIVLSLVLLGIGVGVGWYAPQFMSGSTTSSGQAPVAAGKPAGAPPAGGSGGAPRGVPVELTIVESVSFPRGLSAIGSLRSDESTVVSAEVAGRVAEINFKEGQPVTKGQVLIRLDDEVAQAELAQAQANLALAQSRYERSNRLQTAGFVSAEAREDAQNQLKLQEAAIKLAQAKLDKMTIEAPFDGVIGLRSVSIGEYVTPGQAIAPLEAVDTLKVDFRLPERFITNIALDQTLELQVDARPGQLFTGKVYAISPLIEQGGRSILVRARVDNTDGLLRPGMFARVQLITDESMAVVVPEASLSASGQTQYVYRVSEGQAERVAIQIGERRAGMVEVLQGLEPGDQVVVAGLQRMRPGAAVSPLGEPKPASEVAKQANQSAQSLRVNPQ
ncbi:efflux RND transporter periplasmic adaptor subunit [Orrella daihaiensis]|nr:efflux RND transporter periplasmic adaptor subunit [Orrella daihaiensis]